MAELRAGYIVKHPYLGVGKITSLQPNAIKIRFLTGEEMSFGASVFKDQTITRVRLGLNSQALHPDGECTVTRISSIAHNNAPIQYEVTYTNGLSSVVSELD